MTIFKGKCFPIFAWKAEIKIEEIQIFGPCCCERACKGENWLIPTIISLFHGYVTSCIQGLGGMLSWCSTVRWFSAFTSLQTSPVHYSLSCRINRYHVQSYIITKNISIQLFKSVLFPLKGHYTTGLYTTVWAIEYRSIQKSVLKCNAFYFSSTESQFTLDVYYFTSIVRNNIAPFITCVLNKTTH